VLAAKMYLIIVTFKGRNRITLTFLVGNVVVTLQIVNVRAVKFVDR